MDCYSGEEEEEEEKKQYAFDTALPSLAAKMYK